MAGKPIVELLRETFPASNQEDWKRAASQEIEGQDPLIKLSWKNADELTFLPYYDVSNVATLSFLRNFTLKPGTGHYSSARHWLNLPPVNVANAVTANAQALGHLQQGADGLLFDLRAASPYNPEELLKTIEWPYCSIAFHIHNNVSIQPLIEYLDAADYKADSLSGAIFWDNPAELKNISLDKVISQKNLSSLGTFIAASTPASEICEALINGVKIFSLTGKKNLPAETIASLIAFSIPSENNFLVTIAKFKALRILWYQVARAYGVRDFDPAQLHLHARCQPWIEEKFQPHGNMLSGTMSALAAISGGCNSLTVYPEDENNITQSRIARNISSVLREESHVDKVADPLAGAYVLEVMVNDLSQKAWTLFQAAVQKI